MNPRITLIVVAVFAVLLGYVLLVEQNKTPEQLGTPVPTPPSQIFSLTSNNVQSLEVRDLQSSRQVKLTRTNDGWQIEQPVSKPADALPVDSTISQLSTLQATRVLTNVKDLNAFGFVTATMEVRMVMSDTTPYALTIGAKTPDGAGYYAVYTGDKSKVFIVSSSSVSTLQGWLDTPPYQPTPTPTYTPTPPVTPTAEGTPSPGVEPTGTPAPSATP